MAKQSGWAEKQLQLMNNQLQFLNHQLSHQHDMLHGLAMAVADIARQVMPAGGLTPEEVSALVARLNDHAAKLEGIAATPPPPEPTK